MKQNRFNQVRAQGRIPIGHMLFEFGTRGIAKLLEQSNLDFVVIDTEHSAFDSGHVADLIAWFKATEIAPFVRIPQIDYHLIARPLDAGALGIMIPNVRSAADARKVVEAAKYAPVGDRGCIFGDGHSDFEPVKPADFIDFSNRNTTILCQIESQAGLDHLEEIATVEGIDVLWIGQFDLTQSLGIAGQFSHPKFLNAIKLVVEAANVRKLGVAMQPDSLSQAEEWLELGVNILSYSGDIFVYRNAIQAGTGSLRRLVSNKKT